MIPQPIQPIDVAAFSPATPWVSNTLPSPYSTPGASAPVAVPTPSAFTQSLEDARSTVNSGGITPATTPAVEFSVVPKQDGGVSKKMGITSVETMATRLSEADAKMYRSVQSLDNLDPTSPNLQAELLSVSLMSTKASISTTLAMKFSSKVNESINTLLKTS